MATCHDGCRRAGQARICCGRAQFIVNSVIVDCRYGNWAVYSRELMLGWAGGGQTARNWIIDVTITNGLLCGGIWLNSICCWRTLSDTICKIRLFLQINMIITIQNWISTYWSSMYWSYYIQFYCKINLKLQNCVLWTLNATSIPAYPNIPQIDSTRLSIE